MIGEKKRAKKKIADAYAEIVLRVEDSQLAHMRSHDPEIVWDTLARVHRVRGLATRLALRRQLLTLVKGAEEVMSAWVGHVKAMSHQMEDIGVKFRTRIQSLHLRWDLTGPMILSLSRSILHHPNSSHSNTSFPACSTRKFIVIMLRSRGWL